MWLIYSSEDLVLCCSWGDSRSRVQKLWGVISNQKTEAWCQAFINGFLGGVWFTVPGPVELTVCVEEVKGRVQGRAWRAGWAQSHKLHFKKDNSTKSTQVFSRPSESIYDLFSRYMYSITSTGGLAPPWPQYSHRKTTSVTGSHGFWELRCLLKLAKTHFSFYLFKPWQLQKWSLIFYFMIPKYSIRISVFRLLCVRGMLSLFLPFFLGWILSDHNKIWGFQKVGGKLLIFGLISVFLPFLVG